MTNQRPQPDEPIIPRICKPCRFYEKCQSVPGKFTFRTEDCNYYKAFSIVEKYDREEEADRRFRKMGDG